MDSDLDPRIERALEILYRIEGLSAAKMWQWEHNVAVGVRGYGMSEATLLRRAEMALIALQEPGETWQFGILADP